MTAPLSVALASLLLAGNTSPAPSGDPAGLALLKRVHRAYRAVPAVSVSGRSGSLSFSFTLVLRSGLAVAEQFVGRESTVTTTLVASGPRTFAYRPAQSCWKAVPKSSPQAFDDLGLPFPDQPRMRVSPPRRTRASWLLPVVSDGAPGIFTIDARSLRLDSIALGFGARSVHERVRNLGSAPRLKVPEPRC